MPAQVDCDYRRAHRRAEARRSRSASRWSIENRGGAGGTHRRRGGRRKPRPTATLLIALDQHARRRARASTRSSEYDPVKDFAPISLVAVTPYLLVGQSQPCRRRSVKELVELARRRSRASSNYASAGVGSTTHLAMEMLKSVVADLRAAHPLTTATVPRARRCHRRPGGDPVRQPAGAARQARPAVCARSRSARRSARPRCRRFLPSPNPAIPGFDASLMARGRWRPAGAPQPIIDRLHKETRDRRPGG